MRTVAEFIIEFTNADNKINILTTERAIVFGYDPLDATVKKLIDIQDILVGSQIDRLIYRTDIKYFRMDFSNHKLRVSKYFEMKIE